MSIDEAINILKQYVDYDNPDVPDFYTMEEAIKVIIKALEQDPCENVPDINDGNIYECSCGYGWDQSKVVRHHFCPNCGRAVDNLIKTELNRVKTELEPCEDAVSRQAAIDAITKTSGIRGDALKALYDLPSVTPQPKMGRWIMSDDGLYRPICNNCGAHPWKGYIPTVEEATEAFKYCPNCGAKMQEVEG